MIQIYKSIKDLFVHKRRFEQIDTIFYIGNRFSAETYAPYQLPMHRIYPSTSPKLRLDYRVLKEKNRTSFLYFGGDGLICKGLDLVLEAFDGLDGVTLDICCPDSEMDFWEYYKPLLERNPHICFHGFVQVDSDKFTEITLPCLPIQKPKASSNSSSFSKFDFTGRV